MTHTANAYGTVKLEQLHAEARTARIVRIARRHRLAAWLYRLADRLAA